MTRITGTTRVFYMLVQQVPEYLRFFGFETIAATLQSDLGAVRALLYPK